MLTVMDTIALYFASQGYFITDALAKGGDATISYTGFTDRDGNWYIQEKNTTTGTYRYAKGSSGYTTAWSAREAGSYSYFYTVFA